MLINLVLTVHGGKSRVNPAADVFLDTAESVQEDSFTEVKGNKEVRGHVKCYRIEHTASPFLAMTGSLIITCSLYSPHLKSPIFLSKYLH